MAGFVSILCLRVRCLLPGQTGLLCSSWSPCPKLPAWVPSGCPSDQNCPLSDHVNLPRYQRLREESANTNSFPCFGLISFSLFIFAN